MYDIPETFKPPPEAPVFEPTAEEFENPLTFIARIKPIVEKVGICKVRPPADWQPPFAVDVENFRFVPRMQKINELEATTRVKLNFLDKLLKFWELQGTAIKIPTVDRKLLDFHKLHKVVQKEGGFDTVTKERKWTKVAYTMNLNDSASNKCNGAVLRGHYEKYLYPFDLFEAGITIDQNALKEEIKKEELQNETETIPVIPQVTTTEMASSESDKPASLPVSSDDNQTNGSSVQPRGRKRKEAESKAFMKTYAKSPKKESREPNIDYSANSELRKLQFFGAGPKAAVPVQLTKAQQAKKDCLPVTPPVEVEEPVVQKDVEKKDKMRMRDRSANWKSGYLETNPCVQCDRNTDEVKLLICDSCADPYHMYCLVPPLPDHPKGDWRCPKCVAKECNKPKAAYGFEQAKREFSLQEFGEMADQFKADYFQMPVHLIPTDMVEREFWRLTTCLEEDVTVHYGADIHALTNGSGFPTKDTKDLLPGDEKYIDSKWNLNNLPVHDKSVLKYVTGDVSGMKVPWNYVGMCFSSFCWHIEDHWSYSVNYMHWGEPKTWYGVPSSHAEKLENVMKSQAPELFEQSPDLLHHITTIMNPNYLMAQGIPIVRTDQMAGEFILTFPRAYHAGFNQGYNFAEAVNFCPSDWLPFGRGCIQNYKSVKRHCVFSHEELICKMAADPDSMDLQLAAETHHELLAIVEYERRYRKRLLALGVTKAEREAFELVPDDERQCCYCKTTCFLSALTCPCKPDLLVCTEHPENLCSCPMSEKVLRYRYTLEELPAMISQLKKRAESYDQWSQSVNEAMNFKDGRNKLELTELRKLLSEAREQRYPDSSMLRSLHKTVQEAEKCASLASQLVQRKINSPRINGNGGKRAKLTVLELEKFLERMKSLPCIIKETAWVEEVLAKVDEFEQEAQACLTAPVLSVNKIGELYQIGCTLDLDLPEVPRLKQALAQAQWLDEIHKVTRKESLLTLEAIKDLMEQGMNLAPHESVEKALTQTQLLLNDADRWEEKARICLHARPRHIMSTLEAIIHEARYIAAELPNITALQDALKKAKEWAAQAEDLLDPHHPFSYLDTLEELVNRGRPIPVRLDLLPQMESQVTAAKSWRERTARTFLKKNSTYTLLEVLSPRSEIGMFPITKKRKKKDVSPDVEPDRQGHAFCDSEAMMEFFKRSEQGELESMRALRLKNAEKHRQDDAVDAKYCQCRKGVSGYMFQCELCKEWFHAQCLPNMKPHVQKNRSSQAAWLQAAKENKFLCPFCLRSRRPRLETILSLLVSLQKLPVRLPEGEALQCLTERAMAWQDRARNMLARDDLASAHAKLSVLSQKMVEQAAREKTAKIIDAEIQKAASNPQLQGHLSHSNTNPVSLPTVKTEPADPSPGVVLPIEPVDVKPSCDMSEHAYSSVSKNSSQKSLLTTPSSTGSNTDSPRKHARKSPLIPLSLDTSPVLDLPHMTRVELEELMMEGDLLEVSLDETQHIWKILQACISKSNDNPRVMEFEEQDLDFPKPFLMKKEKRKKIKREAESPNNSIPELKSDVVRKKIKKEIIKTKKKDLKKTGSPGAPSPIEKKVKKIKRKPKALGKKLQVDKNTGAVEEEEDCAAIKCLKPVGDEVDWVQCDKCEKWFHLTCQGMTKHDLRDDEDYVCRACVPPTAARKVNDLGGGDQAKATATESEEIISVVGTPVPSASQSPVSEVVDSCGDAKSKEGKPSSQVNEESSKEKSLTAAVSTDTS